MKNTAHRPPTEYYLRRFANQIKRKGQIPGDVEIGEIVYLLRKAAKELDTLRRNTP